MFRRYLSPEGGDGGGAAPQTPAPAPVAPKVPPSQPDPTPAVTTDDRVPSPAPEGSQPASSPAPPGSSGGEDKRVISRMPTIDTPEYWKEFETLSIDDRKALEQEIFEIENGMAQPPVEKGEEPTPPVGEPPAPGEEPDLFLTQEELNKLDPKTKSVIEKMQSHITSVEPFLDDKVRQGLEVFTKDPVIAARIAEINKEGDPFAIAGELTREFDPNTLMDATALESLDPVTDPDGFKKGIHDSIKKAYEKGAKDADLKAQIQNQENQEMSRRAAIITQQFDSLISKRPELKVPDGVTSLKDPRHPASKFFGWVQENYGDDFFLKNQNAAEAAYMAYQTVTGGMKTGFSNAVKADRFKFIRNMQKAEEAARTIPPNAPSSPGDKTQNILPGLDVERYLADHVYATKFFDNADYQTRLKLENLRETGRLT